ncbi:hypothetical protein L207DRAFT_517207 [Hyaloscypha variabilis F]|uniref:Uncharacterized protein n=1 Tax=Hyaloscypha variabilis (strain UAMH 11265 / GT02V1 / F) TaxID=1149755 RepID=A0A2J6R9C5_HYAVF|nr:hypothetical protein L207DRAFT_517207 [Hyaloscypha variabilis F]
MLLDGYELLACVSFFLFLSLLLFSSFACANPDIDNYEAIENIDLMELIACNIP